VYLMNEKRIQTLADILEKTPAEVESVLLEADHDNRRIIHLLCARNWLEQSRIPQVRAILAGINLWKPAEIPPEPSLMNLFTQDRIEELGALPVVREGEEFLVAMTDPLDLEILERVEDLLKMAVKPLLSDIQTLINCFNGGFTASEPPEPEDSSAYPETTFELEEPIEIDLNALQEYLTDSDSTPFEGDFAIMQVVELLLATAVQREASDIHIDPDESVLRVRMRINGILEDIMNLNPGMSAPIVSRIKIMGNMDMSEKRNPQDGYISHHKTDGSRMDVRVSSCPVVHGEKIVLRLLQDSGSALTLDMMDLTPDVVSLLKNMAHAPHGMVIIAGPTGSGKTTTLYGVLREVDAVTENILTVEDPVEYHVDRINQVQVNNKAGRTFAGTLRSFLRQDPDVILVGETRDAETAEIGLQAALTGHLVLTTLHANSVTQIPARLNDLGVPRHLIATALLGGIGQRLMRRLCPKCKKPVEKNDPTALEALGLKEIPPGIRLFEAVGCPACGETGYSGRLAIIESMPVNPQIRHLIHTGAQPEEIRHAIDQQGFHGLRLEAIRRYLKGQTSLEEVLRHTMAEE